jgi:hypothetical protein
MLSSNVYFRPYSLPIENPNDIHNIGGYKYNDKYEYLVFKEYYCIDDYILTSNMDL